MLHCTVLSLHVSQIVSVYRILQDDIECCSVLFSAFACLAKRVAFWVVICNQVTCYLCLCYTDVMQQFEHPHIVKLVGICSKSQPVWIVMELAKHGEVGHIRFYVVIILYFSPHI